MKLETFDLFAVPVTLTYKGKKTHPTKLGGFISIFYSITCSAFLASRTWIWLSRNGDDYS